MYLFTHRYQISKLNNMLRIWGKTKPFLSFDLCKASQYMSQLHTYTYTCNGILCPFGACEGDVLIVDSGDMQYGNDAIAKCNLSAYA